MDLTFAFSQFWFRSFPFYGLLRLSTFLAFVIDIALILEENLITLCVCPTRGLRVSLRLGRSPVLYFLLKRRIVWTSLAANAAVNPHSAPENSAQKSYPFGRGE
jgi:hypothetical protein